MRRGDEMSKATRGRPAGTMTPNRQRILAEYLDAIAEGRRVSLAELARRTGMCDFRNARRTLDDLKRMGRV